MFPEGGERAVTPWPRGGRRKDIKDYDEPKVHAALAAPAQLQEIDPRNLRSTQPDHRSGVEYYSTPEYHRTGRTYQTPSVVTGAPRATDFLWFIGGKPIPAPIVMNRRTCFSLDIIVLRLPSLRSTASGKNR
jgi:hypothetical protein